jgi:hypothetical protein
MLLDPGTAPLVEQARFALREAREPTWPGASSRPSSAPLCDAHLARGQVGETIRIYELQSALLAVEFGIEPSARGNLPALGSLPGKSRRSPRR